jgi:hypothetical protein
VATILLKTTSEETANLDRQQVVGCYSLLPAYRNSLMGEPHQFQFLVQECSWTPLIHPKAQKVVSQYVTISSNILQQRIMIQELTCNSLMVGWKARRVFPKFLATWKKVSKWELLSVLFHVMLAWHMQLLPPSKEAETWEEFVKSLEGLNVPKRDIHGWKKRQPGACSSRLRKIPGKGSTNLSLMYTIFPCISARHCFHDLNPWPQVHKKKWSQGNSFTAAASSPSHPWMEAYGN